jgi:nucleoid DNA-binding protein
MEFKSDNKESVTSKKSTQNIIKKCYEITRCLHAGALVTINGFG